MRSERFSPCCSRTRNFRPAGIRRVAKGDSLSIDLSFAPDRLVGAERWYVVSDTLDFGGSDWHAEPLALSGTGRTTVTVPFPSLGYAACYVDLIYRTAGGRPYRFSTRIFLFGGKRVF